MGEFVHNRFGRPASWRMILSVIYTVPRRLLSLPALLLRGDVSKEVDLLVLRHD